MNGTGNMLQGSTPSAPALTPPAATIPPRPARAACPPWCTPATCSLVHDESWGGWAGLHAEPVRMIETPDAWWAVQLQAYVSADGTGDTAPGVSLDTGADGLDWLSADDADRLAIALHDAANRLRAASGLPYLQAA
jgi:hypothetical protein